MIDIALKPHYCQTDVSGSVTLLNEIRIGNFIQLKNEDYITTVEPSTFSLGVMVNVNYEPVPITQEWLLKFGFEKLIDNEFTLRYDLKKDPRFDYFFPKHNLKTFGLRFQGITLFDEIKYIHQLQNLYFLLTAKELKL